MEVKYAILDCCLIRLEIGILVQFITTGNITGLSMVSNAFRFYRLKNYAGGNAAL